MMTRFVLISGYLSTVPSRPTSLVLSLPLNRTWVDQDTFKKFVKGKDAITSASRSHTTRPVRSEETKGVTKGGSSANAAGEARASLAAAGDEDTKVA